MIKALSEVFERHRVIGYSEFVVMVNEKAQVIKVELGVEEVADEAVEDRDKLKV